MEGLWCPPCEDGLLSSEDSERAQHPIRVPSHLMTLIKAPRWPALGTVWYPGGEILCVALDVAIEGGTGYSLTRSPGAEWAGRDANGTGNL